MIARFCKGSGWTYNLGDRIGLGPKAAQDLLVHVYGFRPSEAREKLTHARNGSIVPLPRGKVPA
jgi:hypothetical protein